MIAVAATATVPQIGFVHEDSGIAFVLDVADLVRTSATVPVAFAAARACMDDPRLALEREVRKRAAEAFRRDVAVASEHTNWKQAVASMDACIAQHGRIDILVTNAGVLRDNRAGEHQAGERNGKYLVHDSWFPSVL